MIILLIDERPEEVTDFKEYIEGNNVEVIYSTFDELPEHHKRVSEMVLSVQSVLWSTRRMSLFYWTVLPGLPEPISDRPAKRTDIIGGLTRLHYTCRKDFFWRCQEYERRRQPDGTCHSACGNRQQDG